MRVPLNWLYEYVQPGLDAAALAERLALTGTEVERVSRHGVPAVDNFVVGRVLSADKHPDADRLKVCQVDLGDGEPTQIVCGAPNVAAGQTVAVARPGAVMPDGTRLRKAKLRGVESHGMILSEPELQVGVDRGGIMVLGLDGDGPAPGTPLADVLPISTAVLELEITPNRPDCLGVYGVAREVHAATGAPLAPPPWAEDPGTPGEVEGVAAVVETDRCARFMLRRFDDVKVGPSPAWLKARLTAAGMRPVNNVVDVTNYVMLLTGEPLHAFDLDRVAGGRLTIRDGRDGDELVTLDGELRRLDPDMIVICDEQGPTSLAGVMGGERSEVHDGTTRVLLEAATWDGPSIQRTSTRLGLRSEASGRFEKGLAPEQAAEALALATRLLIELCGARVVPGTVDVGGPGPEPAVIRLREERVAGLLGTSIPRARCAEILTALGFGVAAADDGLDVTVPPFRRNDVAREADLIEEVARIDGLDKLPATLPSAGRSVGRLSPAQRLRRLAADTLVGAGLHEVVGWSWSAADLADRLRLDADDPRRRAVAVENPMSAEHAQMRTTLLGSLLDVARHNVAHGAGDVAIFEMGAVYLPEPGAPLPREPQHLAALMTGAARPASWREPSPPAADFFAAKAALERLLGALRVGWRVEPAGEPFLHPGRAAAIVLARDGGEIGPIGWLGELHPRVAADWELQGAVAAFELDLDAAIAAVPGPVRFADYASFPEVRQDLAVVVSADVAAADVARVVREAGGPLLGSAEVFDVYRGEQIGPDEVSLALRLTFRSPERTLTDEEVAERRAAIEAALAQRLGGRLRG